MKRTARLIITFACPRKCSYCSNNYTSILDQRKTVKLDDLGGFDEICITGGEPSLDVPRLVHIVSRLKNDNPFTNIFIYSALYRSNWLYEVVDYIDGVHFTLHENSDIRDVHNFQCFQLHAAKYPSKSFRLYIHPNNSHCLEIYPWIWKRVEIKPFLSESECKLPENETLFELED